MIKFRCEHCAQKIGVPDDLLGRHVKCPRCKERVLVSPGPVASPPGPAKRVKKPVVAAPRPPEITPPEQEEEPSAPTRILRGQTLDMEEKAPPPPPPPEAPAEPAPAKAAQASLMSIAGINANTPIGTKQTTGAAGETTGIALAEKGPNWPGIAAAFVAFAAGVLISVSAPTAFTLTLAGAGAVLGISGLVVSLTARKWEYWSAVVGVTLSLLALSAAYAIGASRDAALLANRIKSSNPVAATQTARSQGAVAPAPAPVLAALVPERARVTVESVQIGTPELRPDAAGFDRSPRLLIYLTISNLSDQSMDYLSWGPGGRIASLSSSSGIQFTPVSFPPGILLNHPQRTRISARSSEHDVLVYEALHPMPAYLSLDLPSDNLGSSGNLHITIPASSVKP